MLTDAEYAALLEVESNAARSLYVLGLRPNAHAVTGATQPIHYPSLCKIVSTKDEPFTQGRQINRLLKHLLKQGLVKLGLEQNIEHTLRDQRIVLPMMIVANEPYIELHTKRFGIHMQWTPDERLFSELAQLVGLLDKQYTQEDIGDFISYWMGRPDKQFSQFQWTQKFVLQRKTKMGQQAQPTTHTVGYQSVSQDGKIQIDDKTKAFIERYKDKSNK